MAEDVKYILLCSRELNSCEKKELKRFFRVYSFDMDTLNNRTLTELLHDYDVVVLNVDDSKHRQYYSENLKLLDNVKQCLNIFVGKFEEDEKCNKADFENAYHVDYFCKKIPCDNKDKNELLHKITSKLLPKLKKKSYKKIILDLLVSALSYIIPKLAK